MERTSHRPKPKSPDSASRTAKDDRSRACKMKNGASGKKPQAGCTGAKTQEMNRPRKATVWQDSAKKTNGIEQKLGKSEKARQHTDTTQDKASREKFATFVRDAQL